MSSAPSSGKIGHLQREPTEINCPSCNAVGLSTLRLEAVTCIQKIVGLINCCLCCTPIKWEGRHDYNHYCSKCGCYIGRNIQLSWYKRKLFKSRHAALDEDMQWRNYQRQKSTEQNKTEQSEP
ncbi:uncharacterized protein LOC129906943 [Episyrphus balteatus]|uniref:uncharacterized protein LOC129906943 n=1 Tax=Episyrphus balteatus TaxID=286459 RepID=UPI002485E1EA|nr:uncharacterized protein LOC129906943 [Episyrphus balteatus]